MQQCVSAALHAEAHHNPPLGCKVGPPVTQDGYLVLLQRFMHSGHCCRWGATPLQDAYLVHDKVMYAMLERAGAKMSDDGAIKAKLQNQTVGASNQTLSSCGKMHAPKAVPACLFTRLPAAGRPPCSNLRCGQLAFQPEGTFRHAEAADPCTTFKSCI